MDTVASELETHRFRPKPEDRVVLDKARNAFEAVQVKYPQIKGLAFYGSRTKGLSGRFSDLDVYIFYDGSELKNPYDEGFHPNNLEPEKMKKWYEYDQTVGKKAVLDNTRKMIQDAIEDPNNEYPGHPGIHAFNADISQEATDDLIRQLVEEPTDVYDPHQRIVSRFYLGIGDGLYQGRKYILDRLESVPKGEDIFKLLMEVLQNVERKAGQEHFKGYPQSIAEARKYFLVK